MYDDRWFSRATGPTLDRRDLGHRTGWTGDNRMVELGRFLPGPGAKGK